MDIKDIITREIRSLREADKNAIFKRAIDPDSDVMAKWVLEKVRVYPYSKEETEKAQILCYLNSFVDEDIMQNKREEHRDEGYNKILLDIKDDIAFFLRISPIRYDGQEFAPESFGNIVHVEYYDTILDRILLYFHMLDFIESHKYAERMKPLYTKK